MFNHLFAQTFPVCWKVSDTEGVEFDKGTYSIDQSGVLISTEKVGSGDGFVEFLIQSDLTEESMWIGLSEQDNLDSWKDFTYSIGVDAFGSPETKHAYNLGTWKAGFSRVARGDRLRIAIENGQVIFSSNDQVFYTMNAVHTADLYVVVYFNVIQNRTYQTTLDITSSADCNEIVNPEILNAQLSATNADFQQNNGTVTAQITSGKPPYRVEWSNGEVIENTTETTHILSNLSSGLYGVTISDATDQIVVPFEVTVNENPSTEFSIQMSKTDVSYPNGNDGTVTAQLINATPPFLVEWSRGEVIDGTYLPTQTIYGLPQGDYQVTITDGNQQRLVSELISVNEPSNAQLNLIMSKQDVEFGSDGRATVTIDEGEPPYSIEWSTGEQVSGGFAADYTIYGLSAGKYSVTVSDNLGKTQNAEILVADERGLPLQVILSRIDLSSENANDGSVAANISGGIAPYQIQWSTGIVTTNSNETVHIISNLSPGDYSITVIDEVNDQVTAGPITVNDYQPANCGTINLNDCTDSQPNINTSLGEPQKISLPTTYQSIYSGGRDVPTFRQMFGTNMIITNTFDYSGMENISDIFSYPRVFLFNNKDYWDDGIGEPTTESKKRIIRPREIERLKILVDQDGAPFLRGSFIPGDRIISIDPATGDFVETPITPQNYSDFSAAQQNTYTGYMNSNFRFIQEHYDKWESEQNRNINNPYKFNGLTVTLTVVNANFPSSISAEYNFPANWWKPEDWGFNLGQIKC
ncbi:MAG: SprB repeat-containing protein, partial [Saprospiraceae bacterium]